jgi:AraC family transcriptional regulator of arabinose operon
MDRPFGLPYFVLLVTRTSGQFQIGPASFSVSPGSALLFAPGTAYAYGNHGGDYVDDWIHFDIDPDFPFRQNLLSMSNVPFPVENQSFFSRCIRQLLWEAEYTPSQYADDNISALCTLLFNHLEASFAAKDQIKAATSLQKQMLGLRMMIRENLSQEHRISLYAKKLNISESYFQMLYKEIFHVTFGQDLILMRVEQAKFLLTSTALSAGEIAGQCGYANEVHFYRQFKKMTGMTPHCYRKTTV